ncbi:hypothetical protein LTR10_001139 [Elasticomyces elasticus]|nr:hypothetical protein LTR10_001139 [Elasticomyces elasticus]KAK4965495.1 hypothetical protein LTR42_012251 [Elasticomyces elasticus]
MPAMHGDGGSIHPFFKRTNEDAHATEDEGEPIEVEQLDGSYDEKPKPKRNRKPKAQLEEDGKGKKQKTLQDILNPKPAPAPPVNGNTFDDAINLVSSDPIVAPPKRKRKRPSQMEAPPVVDDLVIPNSTSDPVALYSEPAAPPRMRAPSSPRVVIPPSSPLLQPVPLSEDGTAGVNAGPDLEASNAPPPPKKVLRLNANGRFSSPVRKKEKQDADPEAVPDVPRRRGKPRKSKEAARLVVTMSYSTAQADLGLRIDRILSGSERVAVPEDKQPNPQKLRTPRKSKKPTHPFFGGKPKDEPQPKVESPRKTTATTPGKLRMQVLSDRVPSLVKEVPYAVGSGLLKDRLMVKHPGAMEAPWPDREQAHVRGFEDVLPSCADLAPLVSRKRKRKAAEVSLPIDESVLRHYGANLRPEEACRLRSDGFFEPPSNLRVPERLLITGHEIRQRVAPELSVSMHNDAEDILMSDLPTSSQLSVHPAMQKLWDSIPYTLSAFDELKGENVGWTQKYAPDTSGEVLQPAHEMKVLRDWLAALTVSAVESTGAVQKAPAKAEVKPRKKRRRKQDDMDDFLVDSDEEIHNMDELTGPEEATHAAGTKLQKSVVQLAVDGTKLGNAVLLSGPSGCGKTAAAYAVAKELGFKVFEISSSERRSGKDVLDKVGDMTENHLVKHHGIGVDAGELSSAEEPNKARMDEAFERDLASGRQGKMNAFFQPKAGVKPPAPKIKPPTKAKVLKAVVEALKKATKDQQQSLILLEEVDILFKDDKDFWNTVLKLIVSSKRPFIMTCNDEDMVPVQAMSMHAILRFSPPHSDLATDYLLLVAAAEGHLLRRDAVADLYHAKGHDLRASITELDFWCQMAIGDVKGGLGWIYQRWPPGSDVDERGRKLRVVSDGTYVGGMGTVPEGLDDEDKVMWNWREFDVHPTSTVEAQQAISLKQHAVMTDALSSMDVVTRPGLLETAPLDTTMPEMLDKARGQYIEGLRLVQADERVDHTDLSMQLVVNSVHALRKVPTTKQHPAAAGKTTAEKASRLSRNDFIAFDAISTAPECASTNYPGLLQSAFDGPLSAIVTDLAPYVRSIVQYDLALEEQRERLNTLLPDGEGRRAKRARTTRAARSAQEGGQRASTRRERWFTKQLNIEGVLNTAGKDWPKTTLNVAGHQTESVSMDSEVAPGSSAEST